MSSRRALATRADKHGGTREGRNRSGRLGGVAAGHAPAQPVARPAHHLGRRTDHPHRAGSSARPLQAGDRAHRQRPARGRLRLGRTGSAGRKPRAAIVLPAAARRDALLRRGGFPRRPPRDPGPRPCRRHSRRPALPGPADRNRGSGQRQPGQAHPVTGAAAWRAAFRHRRIAAGPYRRQRHCGRRVHLPQLAQRALHRPAATGRRAGLPADPDE